MTNYWPDLQRRSAAIPRTLERRTSAIARAWLLTFVFVSLTKVMLSPSPVRSIGDFLELAIPYWLVALAPVAGAWLAFGSFSAGAATAQPQFRLSIYGKWRRVSLPDARSNPAFGPAGFMASMLIGLLLNVALRSAEFVMAMPALNAHEPSWSTDLFRVMAADVVVTSFFYMACFVMALRNIPYFPRMLLFVWALDIFAQLAIARHVAAAHDLPWSVALPLQHLLQGNIQKVLISAFVWLPYLILSDRVNITYRLRARDH